MERHVRDVLRLLVERSHDPECRHLAAQGATQMLARDGTVFAVDDVEKMLPDGLLAGKPRASEQGLVRRDDRALRVHDERNVGEVRDRTVEHD